MSYCTGEEGRKRTLQNCNKQIPSEFSEKNKICLTSTKDSHPIYVRKMFSDVKMFSSDFFMQESSESAKKKRTNTEDSEDRKKQRLEDSKFIEYPPGQYPETLATFMEGIKGDVFELFSSFHKTFKVLLPVINPSNDTNDDVLNDLAVQTPLNMTNEEKLCKNNQYTAALRMRSSNMWSDKENNIQDSALLVANNNTKSTPTSVNTAPSKSICKVREGGKIQLKKIENNPSIQAYPCINDDLIIIGNKRMIYVVKDKTEPKSTLASVVWWQSFSDIESAIITYVDAGNTQNEVKNMIEFQTRNGKKLELKFQDESTSTKILQLIQERATTATVASEATLSATPADVTHPPSLDILTAAPPPPTTNLTVTPMKSAATTNAASPSKDSSYISRGIRSATKSIGNSITKILASVSPKRNRMKNDNRNATSAVEAMLKSRSNTQVSAGNQPPLPSSDSQQQPVDPNVTKKYELMLRAGVPKESVHKKMRDEGVDPTLLHSPVAATKELNAVVATSVDTTNEIPMSLKKFQMMLKAGVPMPAVINKMKTEGISAEDQRKITGETEESKPVINPPPPAAASGNGGAHLVKYRNMLKTGVPPEAVLLKMRNEGVTSIEDQNAVLGNAATNKTDSNSTVVASKPTSKLMAFHWDVLSIDNNISRESIWGQLNLNEDEPGLNTELQQLETLFGKKSTNKNVIKNDGNDRKKKCQPKIIDMTRSTNISICLTSFRSKGVTDEVLLRALSSMDLSILSVDFCSRLLEIIPTETETKACVAYQQDTHDLIDAEKLLIKLTKVESLTPRINAMLFLHSFQQSCETLLTKYNTLREISGRILISESLKLIIKHVLAIGNTLNQGTFKGQQVAFKVTSSLNKLSQTKSTDNKTTLLDYLIEVLHGSNSVALNIDVELELLAKAKCISIADVVKETNSIKKELTSTKLLLNKLDIIADLSSPNNIAINNLLNTADLQINTVDKAMNESVKSLEKMSIYFGEEKSSASSIINALTDFINDFKNGKNKYSQKMKALNKKK